MSKSAQRRLDEAVKAYAARSARAGRCDRAADARARAAAARRLGETGVSKYPSTIILFGGPEFIMRTARGPVRFEWHSYCGPLPCWLNGSGRKIGARHDYWKLVARWARSGKKVEHGNHCVVPPPCASCGGTGKGEHIVGRHYKVCQDCDGPE